MQIAALESNPPVSLSYANDRQPRLQRWVIRGVEQMSGRARYERLYRDWRVEVAPPVPDVFRRLLRFVNVGLDIRGAWPAENLGHGPLVLLANHPFGIGDGAALLSIAEQLGRPFKVLIHSELLKIPEMHRYALPIDFGNTKEALLNNLAVKKEARALLSAGTTIVIFPAGGVATAPRGLGKARDFPWKTFVAKLIQDSHATVIPVHFAGQNGRFFHLVSMGMNLVDHRNRVLRIAGQASMTMRTALLIREFAKLSGTVIRATVGDPIEWADMARYRDRGALLAFLQSRVFGLEGARKDRNTRLPWKRRAKSPFRIPS